MASMVNSGTELYLQDCLQAGSALRSAARDLVLPDAYADSYGKLLLDRPVLVPTEEVHAFGEDLRGLFRLLVSLPDRLFDGDLAAYCAAVSLDPRLSDLMLRGATGRPQLHGRADAYHDGSAFRLLEFNLGSELGGTDSAQLNRAFLDLPAVARFGGRLGLSYVDTCARVATALRRAAAPTSGAGEPTVALVESRDGLRLHRHVFTALQEALGLHGVDLVLGEIQELRERNGKLVLHGRPLDVLLRYFVAGELAADPSGSELLDTVLRSHASDRTVLFTPLESGLFATKAALALLHDPRVKATYTAAEADLVDRVLPWTRLLSSSPDRAELLPQCLARRRSLLLKPGVGYGGVGTTPGWVVDDASWAAALGASAHSDLVVQERVQPALEPVVDAEDGVVRDWVANWGVFVDEEGYAGAFVRALRPEDGSVVSYSNPGTRGTCVSEYGDRTSAPPRTSLGGDERRTTSNRAWHSEQALGPEDAQQ
jgi:hypothetical protein